MNKKILSMTLEPDQIPSEIKEMLEERGIDLRTTYIQRIGFETVAAAESQGWPIVPRDIDKTLQEDGSHDIFGYEEAFEACKYHDCFLERVDGQILVGTWAITLEGRTARKHFEKNGYAIAFAGKAAEDYIELPITDREVAARIHSHVVARYKSHGEKQAVELANLLRQKCLSMLE